MKSLTQQVGSWTIRSSSYHYNDANQRTRQTLADNSYWVYGYDGLGQVNSGKRYWNGGTIVAGQQFEYAHDDVGNRTGDNRTRLAAMRMQLRSSPWAYDVLPFSVKP